MRTAATGGFSAKGGHHRAGQGLGQAAAARAHPGRVGPRAFCLQLYAFRARLRWPMFSREVPTEAVQPSQTLAQAPLGRKGGVPACTASQS